LLEAKAWGERKAKAHPSLARKIKSVYRQVDRGRKAVLVVTELVEVKDGVLNPSFR
jgi:uncharacterized protein YheU (UPF0270 family)